MFFALPIIIALQVQTIIPYDDGGIEITAQRTLGRFSRGDLKHDWALLEAKADAAAKVRPANRWRALFAVVRTIDADWKDADGVTHHTKTTLTDDQIAKLRQTFDDFRRMAFVLTGGALEIAVEPIVVVRPVMRLDGYDWLSAGTALKGVDVAGAKYDSVFVYYRPGDIPIGLLGGSYGKDNGLKGAGTSTVQIPEKQLAETPTFFSLIAIATLHEWLHQASWAARRLMGYSHAPDLHCASMYGYHVTDSGYPEWLLFYRDLMGAIYPERLWRRVSMLPPPLPDNAPPPNAAVRPGSFYNWDEVKGDWMRWLPLVDETYLRERTKIATLTLALKQYQRGSFVQLVLGGLSRDRVRSPLVEYPSADDGGLNNLMTLGGRFVADNKFPDLRVRVNPPPSLVNGDWTRAEIRTDRNAEQKSGSTLEGLAIIRYRTSTHYRDLVFVRMDIADAVAHLLKVIGSRPAFKSVLGYVSLKEPTDGHPVNFLVIDTDLGRRLPKDEAAALGH